MEDRYRTSTAARFPNPDYRPPVTNPLKPGPILILLDNADTLVYIDPTPCSGNILSTRTTPHRVHSEKLLATGSKYIQQLFTPRCQNLVQKQRGFASELPPGVKYVIDLTPPTTDEDAILALTGVSCPMAIRTWASCKDKWNLPPTCVGGEDELDVLPDISKPSLNHEETHATYEFDPTVQNAFDLEDEGVLAEAENREMTRVALPVEYSAKRHREAIEHILHVLEGLNVTLDTPCKLWTFFAVAKFLDVAKVPAVSGYVLSWFYHSTNVRFLEIHPEVSYRVACGIGLASLCVDSFIGLVGDEALLYIMREASLAPPKSWAPILGRSRIADFLEDTEVQRIEYASKSFADKVINNFLYLAGKDMPWMANLGEFEKIHQYLRDFPEDGKLVSELVNALRDFIRYRIYRVLCTAKDPRRSCNILSPNDPTSGGDGFDQPAVVQRIIGRDFWRHLSSLDLASDANFASRVLPHQQHHHSIAEIGNGITAFQGHENARLRVISRFSVELKIQEFNAAVKCQLSCILFHPTRRRALGSSSNYFPDSAVNTSRSVQTLEAPASTDDGHNKPLTLNLRSSQPPQGAHSSSAINKPLNLAFRLHSQPSSGEHQISGRSSNELGAIGPSNSTPSALAVPDSLLEDICAGRYVDVMTFDLDRFLCNAWTWVNNFAGTLLYPHGDNTAPLEATDTLFSLTDDQFRFLPLWAGGLDDGSGGVFTDQNIPNLEHGGFSAPGPAVHTGSVASTRTDNSLSDIDPDDSLSTVQGASHHATHSHVSDLLSVDSRESYDIPVQMRSPVPSMPRSAIASDDVADFDMHSDGGSTVVMESPQLSDIDDEDLDTDVEHLDIDDDDNDHDHHDDDFELVDSKQF